MEETETKQIKLSTLLILKQLFAGVVDALNFANVFRVMSKAEQVPLRLLDILIFNGFISFGSLMVFQFVVGPVIQSMFASQMMPDGSFISYLSYGSEMFILGLYYILWIIPLFLISFIINAQWLQTVSEHALTVLTKKTPATSSLRSLSQLPKGLASDVYTTTFYAMFVFQSLLCSLIPFLGSIINIVILSWLYSLYCFEYKWSTWTIGRRLKYIEDNWAYFAGFGMVVGGPFTLASVYLGFFVGYAVWFLLFPMFIITAIGSREPPNRVLNKEGKISFALFIFAKWLNTFCLNSLVVIIKFLTGGRKTA